MPTVRRKGNDGKEYEAPSERDWAMGVRNPVSEASDRTTKEIGETIGGFKQGAKSTTSDKDKGPAPTPPPAGASLGEQAAYQRAKREWDRK